MTIAVYTNLKSYKIRNPDLYFIKSFLENLSTYYPEHNYFLLLPHSIDEPVTKFDSVKNISVRTTAGLLYNYRLTRKVSQAVQNIKADVLISIDCIFKNKANQLVLLTSLQPSLGKQKLEKAKSIFVLSQHIKDTLNTQQNLGDKRIFVLHGGANNIFQPIDEEMKSIIKEKYTESREFFIYRGRIKEENNIVSLLKAFSLFKKRQKSSMKLLLMGQVFWQGNDFEKLISTYKYRDDVVLVTDEVPGQEASILATAYAMVQPYTTNILFAFDAMQCGVPVLSIQNTTLQEITNDGVLFFNPGNETDIAEKMMLIYKDELLRSQLIERGKNVVENYTWKKTVKTVSEAFTNQI
jgi:glycosyltransferase involved in cell wall biosynthesis